MERILKTEIVPNFLDKGLVSLKASRGFGHLQMQQILVGTLGVEAMEEPA